MRALATLALVASFAGNAFAAHVRVTCTGIHRLSLVEAEVSCEEENVLTDPAGGFITGFSRASSSLRGARLGAAVAGGAIRDVGYNGGESSALFKERVLVAGRWREPVPIRVSLRVAYRFEGYGAAELDAILSTAVSRDPAGDNRLRVVLAHSALRGTRLRRSEGRGRHGGTPDGVYPSVAVATVEVTQMVTAAKPHFDLRAYLTARSVPNLGTLETALSALVAGEATLVIEAPCGVRLSAESGRLPAGALRDAAPGTCERSR